MVIIGCLRSGTYTAERCHHPDHRLVRPTSSQETPQVGLAVPVNNNSECVDLQEYVHTNISECDYVLFCMTRNTCGYLADRDGRLDPSARTSAGKDA